jgi:hypothetical protein
MNCCPSTEILQQLLSGDLPGDSTAALRNYLLACAACRDLLDRHSDNAELRRWAAEALQLPAAPEEELARLLRRLHDRPPASANDTPPPVAATAYPWLAPPRRPGDLGTLGPYCVEAEIGRGGMGLVFRAFDEVLQRLVAVKVLRPERDDAAARARLVREAQLADDHPGSRSTRSTSW